MINYQMLHVVPQLAASHHFKHKHALNLKHGY
jgi:hypothetical protein